MSFLIKILKYLPLLSLGLLSFLSGCNIGRCQLPTLLAENLQRCEVLASQILALNEADSLSQNISCGYHLDNNSKWYALTPTKSQCSNLSAIEKELLFLKIQNFRVHRGNVYLYYHYKVDNFGDEKTYKFLIFENAFVDDYNNSEEDRTWEISCNEKVTDKLRHVVMVEIN